MVERFETHNHDSLVLSASHHKTDIEDYFKSALLRPVTEEEAAFLGQLDLFFVAFTNRSGSTFLTSLMNGAGFPVPPRAEVFNSDMVINTSRDHDIPSFTDYFLQLVRGWAAHNIVGFKAGGQQIAWLAETGLLSHLRSLKVVHCRRRDLVGQAVSFYIATETGQWQSLMTPERRPEEVAYDAAAIEECRQTILRGELAIERTLAHCNLLSMDVYYEDCLQESGSCLRRAGEFLDCVEWINPQADNATVEIEQQRGEVNRAMRQQFLTEFPDTGR